MKFRKNWKRFWTLDRHHAEGFTLVELIVVIAILAILAGVGTVGYSGYVKKANMQADMTLISEIEHALTLAMYGDPFEEESSGVLVLSMDEITYNGSPVVEGSEVDNALKAAFGSDYREVLKLKYDGWEAASHINGMIAANAWTVKNSSYMSGERADMLLQDVEKFTAMAKNLSEALTGTPLTEDTTLASLYGIDLLNETAEKYGIKGPEDNDWDAWGEENPQEYSNLLVLAAALDNQKMTTSSETPHTPSTATNLISEFSQYYAFAATCPKFSPVLTQYLDAMNAGTVQDASGNWYTPITSPIDNTVTNVYKVTSPSLGSAWYRQLETDVSKTEYKNASGLTYQEYIATDEFGDSAAFTDQMAFSNIMSALSSTSEKDVADDLSNSNLFTEGAVKDMYDQYMDAVEVLTSIYDGGNPLFTLDLADGEVAIFYSQNGCLVTDTIN